MSYSFFFSFFSKEKKRRACESFVRSTEKIDTHTHTEKKKKKKTSQTGFFVSHSLLLLVVCQLSAILA